MKFNKDVFLNEITEKVQSAIDKNLLTIEDVRNDNKERLAGFLQYELLNYIEDRKFAIDVLKDFNFDERRDWRALQDEYGKDGRCFQDPFPDRTVFPGGSDPFFQRGRRAGA